MGAPAVPAHLAHGDGLGACTASTTSAAQGQAAGSQQSTNAAQTARLAQRLRAECELDGELRSQAKLRQALQTADGAHIEALLDVGDCARALRELDADDDGKRRGPKQQPPGRARS